jgi:hypothetical protein
MTIPHEPSNNQLKKVGVRLVKSELLTLRCSRCAKTWTIKQIGLRLPKGYWKCPNGCNTSVNN